MRLQYVVVEYPNVRDVFVDRRRWDVTNKTLLVSEGTHRFDLGEPVDYDPSSQKVKVTNTSEQSPMTITFEPA